MINIHFFRVKIDFDLNTDLPKYSPVFVLSCFSRPLEIVIIFVPLSIVKALNLSSLDINNIELATTSNNFDGIHNT
jgi:hypothetical protein